MNYNAGKYDIAVIGAGHAGCEAALACARMGMKTLIFSISLEAVANMPCNPHIGGRDIWLEKLMHWEVKWEKT